MKKNSSLRVLLITSTFPRNKDEVLAKWLGDMALQIKKQGIKIDVFAPAFKGSSSHKYYGIPVYRFRYAPTRFETLTHDEGAIVKIRNNPFFLVVALMYLFFGLISIIRYSIKEEYDIIHVHWPLPNGLFGILSKYFMKGKHAKIILNFHGAEFTLAKHVPFGKNILSYVIKNANQVITNSNFTKNEVLKIRNSSIEIIPFSFGMRLASQHNTNKTIKKKNEQKRILFVGRLIERKGVIYLIKAMPEVLRNIDARLDIVGRGPSLENLKKEIKELGLEDKVKIHPDVDDKSLGRFYKECDVFVLPSIIDRWGDTEGLGVVILEAMSFRKPVVASRVGGIVDIIKNNETGFLVSQKNPKELAQVIIKTLRDKKMADEIGKRGAQVVSNNFSWKGIIKKTANLYRNIL